MNVELEDCISKNIFVFKSIQVFRFHRMAYQVSRPNDDTDRTLWMGDLNADWDQAFIAEAFARMGEDVTNVKIVFDKHSGKVVFIRYLKHL